LRRNCKSPIRHKWNFYNRNDCRKTPESCACAEYWVFAAAAEIAYTVTVIVINLCWQWQERIRKNIKLCADKDLTPWRDMVNFCLFFILFFLARRAGQRIFDLRAADGGGYSTCRKSRPAMLSTDPLSSRDVAKIKRLRTQTRFHWNRFERDALHLITGQKKKMKKVKKSLHWGRHRTVM